MTLLRIKTIAAIAILSFAIGCAAKKQPSVVQTQQTRQTPSLRAAEQPNLAAAPPAEPDLMLPVPEEPEGPEPLVSQEEEALLEVETAAIKKCPNLPPICPGGLVSQHATAEQINKHVAKWKLEGLNCRYMQPPRCYTGQQRTCVQQCIP